jgi:multimeric flavodoxin WrbA
MKDVLLVNGSPRGEKATSLIFLKNFADLLDPEEFRTTTYSIGITNDRPTPEYILTALSKTDAVVFSFPLYAYTTPAAFTKFLEDYYFFRREQAGGGYGSRENAQPDRPAGKAPKVYAFVNCGYAVPGVNRETLQVMRHFCSRTGMEWRFGAAIGGGLIVAMTQNIPIVNVKLRKVYKKIAADIGGKGSTAAEAENSAEEGISAAASKILPDIYIKPIIPKAVMNKMKDSKWAKKFMAKTQTPGARQ